MININEVEKLKIIRHKNLILDRIERDFGDISYYNHNRMVSLINDRFAIMLEEEFKVIKKG